MRIKLKFFSTEDIFASTENFNEIQEDNLRNYKTNLSNLYNFDQEKKQDDHILFSSTRGCFLHTTD